MTDIEAYVKQVSKELTGNPMEIAQMVRNDLAASASGRGAGYDEIAAGIGQPVVTGAGDRYEFTIDMGSVSKPSLNPSSSGVYNLGGLFDQGWATSRKTPFGMWHGRMTVGRQSRPGSNWIQDAYGTVAGRVGSYVSGDYTLQYVNLL